MGILRAAARAVVYFDHEAQMVSSGDHRAAAHENLQSAGRKALGALAALGPAGAIAGGVGALGLMLRSAAQEPAWEPSAHPAPAGGSGAALAGAMLKDTAVPAALILEGAITMAEGAAAFFAPEFLVVGAVFAAGSLAWAGIDATQAMAHAYLARHGG